MNSSTLHLLLNHIPVIGGLGALLPLGWGLYRRSLKVTLFALTAFVIVGIVSVPVFLSGRTAGASLDGMHRPAVDEHKDAAIAAMVGLEAAAGVALAALFCWRTTRRFPMFSAVATLILGLAASILVVRAATLGGDLRHPQIHEQPARAARAPM